MTDEINWGPTGKLVFDRTYSRTKPDGTKETWPETVERVVDGNLALVDERYQLTNERQDLIDMIQAFKILPAGRHLWASGVKNAQHLFNCWVAGWTETPSEHFEFTFMRLMEGGGVGSNYSNSNLIHYKTISQSLSVEIVCDEDHADYDEMLDAGVLSCEYDSDWSGAFIIEDSREGWAAALVDLINTYYRTDDPHYHRVYDVSRIRKAGAKLKTFGGYASGPLPFSEMLIKVNEILRDVDWLTGLNAMEIDHAIAECVVAGGVRRAARMAMMHWEDQQVHEFINIKADSLSHWTTNISVEVDAKFWNRVNAGEHRAMRVLRALSSGAVLNGEPGMWDSSLSNEGEPNKVICTNPCGEITLEAWEPCNLGHVNLAAFVREDTNKVDYLGLDKAHRLMTRFLIRATFSPVADPKSREVLDRNRRIGVGHFGVASFLALTGKKYSNAPADKEFKGLLRSLKDEVARECIRFSHQLRIPVPVKATTVAPTGTIAKLSGVSEGAHPIFAKFFNRRIRFTTTDPDQLSKAADLEEAGFHVEDDLYAKNTLVVTIPTQDILLEQVAERYGAKEAEEIVQGADDLTLNEMLAFQAMYQTCWADNAVSFTANVDPDTYTADDVAEMLVKFSGMIKGSTLFPEKSYEQAPYERITKAEYEAASVAAVSDGVDEDCANGACPIR